MQVSLITWNILRYLTWNPIVSPEDEDLSEVQCNSLQPHAGDLNHSGLAGGTVLWLTEFIPMSSLLQEDFDDSFLHIQRLLINLCV